MLTNLYIVQNYGGGDVSRLGAQVISGIGFLGIGTIIVNRQNQVKGLTTAAGLWACACMGLAIGIGFYSAAILSCLLIFSTITVLNNVERKIIFHSHMMEVYVEFKNYREINDFIGYLSDNGIDVASVKIVPSDNEKRGKHPNAAAIIILKLHKKQYSKQILEFLKGASGVLNIEEIS
jgi:putative Mg2+ transporter-C (MgtC) family protein